MELTVDKKQYFDQLMQFEESIYQSYFGNMPILSFGKEKDKNEVLHNLITSFAVENYLLFYRFQEFHPVEMLAYVKEQLQKMSTVNNEEAILTSELETFKWRRLIGKLQLLSDEEFSSEECLLESFDLKKEEAFLYFLHQDSNSSSLLPEVRKRLLAAKFSIFYLSPKELLHCVDGFAPHKGIFDYAKDTQEALEFPKEDYHHYCCQYGGSLVNEQIVKLLQLEQDDLEHNPYAISTAILRQELVRTGMLFLSSAEIEELYKDFNTYRSINEQIREYSPKALDIIYVAFDCSQKDKEKVYRKT